MALVLHPMIEFRAVPPVDAQAREGKRLTHTEKWPPASTPIQRAPGGVFGLLGGAVAIAAE